MEMTRFEALDALIGAWQQRDTEFCVGDPERDQSRAELIAALTAIGVADYELADLGL